MAFKTMKQNGFYKQEMIFMKFYIRQTGNCI